MKAPTFADNFGPSSVFTPPAGKTDFKLTTDIQGRIVPFTVRGHQTNTQTDEGDIPYPNKTADISSPQDKFPPGLNQRIGVKIQQPDE